jgi:agmatine deiminase
MIQDSETNLLYLADCLPKKNPAFTGEFLQLLNHNYIKYKYLPNTKDIWAVGYMPLQLANWRRIFSLLINLCPLVNV